MSGHSKWSTIKHKKAAQDAKRANIFTKFARLISVTAREGGGDLDANFKLKMAIDKAKAVNMPKENIERAIKKGTGELKDGAEIEEVIYEAYGPGQVAMLIKTATDNINRTVGEIKSILTKAGGKMVAKGSVSFMFKKVGEIEVNANDKDIDELELLAIEAGADDIKLIENSLIIYTKVKDLQMVKEFLEKKAVEVIDAFISFLPTQTVQIDKDFLPEYEKFLEKLEECDDVQEVYSNLI